LKLICDEPLPNVAFKFELRRYNPVAYTLLGRATFTGQWQEMASFVPHHRPDGRRDFMVRRCQRARAQL
jgi:hypothetical protein